MAAEGQQEVSGVVGGAAPAPMCANGCGFFGCAATNNFCSKCYKDHLIKTAVVPVAEKKIEIAKKAAAAAAHVMPEQEQLPGGGQDPDATAAAVAVVATATPVIAQAPTASTEKENAGGPVETEKHEASGGGAAAAAPLSARTGAVSSALRRPTTCAPAATSTFSRRTRSSSSRPSNQRRPRSLLLRLRAAPAPAVVNAAPNRCATCRKKVGLLGFPCRCGGTFRSLHRYAEKHACDFDFKAAGREKIAKNNPIVVAAKINKI